MRVINLFLTKVLMSYNKEKKSPQQMVLKCIGIHAQNKRTLTLTTNHRLKIKGIRGLNLRVKTINF